MNTKSYRLIEMLENYDYRTNLNILIFELSEVQYDDKISQYSFSTTKSQKFIFEKTTENEAIFMNDPHEVKNLNIDHFNEFLINEQNSFEKIFIRNDYYEKILASSIWLKDALQQIENGRQICIKFSHTENCMLKYNSLNEVVPVDISDITLKEQVHYLTIDKKTITYYFENPNGIFILIKARIVEFKNISNKIMCINAIGKYGQLGNLNFEFLFDSTPVKYLTKSIKNVIVNRIESEYNKPRIFHQFSLLFPEYLGSVEL